MKKRITKYRFRSRSEHTLDDKGRLNIPARFREILKEKYESEFLIVTNWHNCLRVYPEDEWEEFEEDLLSREQPTEEEEQFIRYVVSGVAECALDKQGRILLTQLLRDKAKLDKEVVLTGMGKWFEIWDKPSILAKDAETMDDSEAHQATLAEMGFL